MPALVMVQVNLGRIGRVVAQVDLVALVDFPFGIAETVLGHDFPVVCNVGDDGKMELAALHFLRLEAHDGPRGGNRTFPRKVAELDAIDSTDDDEHDAQSGWKIVKNIHEHSQGQIGKG